MAPLEEQQFRAVDSRCDSLFKEDLNSTIVLRRDPVLPEYGLTDSASHSDYCLIADRNRKLTLSRRDE
jgi:hypothetical protein